MRPARRSDSASAVASRRRATPFVSETRFFGVVAHDGRSLLAEPRSLPNRQSGPGRYGVRPFSPTGPRSVMAASATSAAEPGTLMSAGDDGWIAPSNGAYDHTVVGVVTGADEFRPGSILGAGREKQAQPKGARRPGRGHGHGSDGGLPAIVHGRCGRSATSMWFIATGHPASGRSPPPT